MAGWPPAGTRQSTEMTGAPCSATAPANSGSPTFTTTTRAGRGLAGCVIVPPFRFGPAGRRGGDAGELRVRGRRRTPAGGRHPRPLGVEVARLPGPRLRRELACLGAHLPRHPGYLGRGGAAE